MFVYGARVHFAVPDGANAEVIQNVGGLNVRIRMVPNRNVTQVVPISDLAFGWRITKRDGIDVTLCQNCLFQIDGTVPFEMLTGYCVTACKCDRCGRTADLAMVLLKGDLKCGN